MDSSDKRIVFIVILISGIFLGSVLVRLSTNSEYRSSYELPSEIGMWQGKDTENNLKKLKEELGTQSIVFRTYTHKDYLVTLFLAYYKDIDSADKVHAPQVCYSGQGWTINSDQVIPCKVLNKNIDINRLVIEKEKNKEIVYNWWQTGIRVFPRNSSNRFYQMLQSMLGKNTSTLWIRLSINASDNIRMKETGLVQFSQALMPYLNNYFTH